MTRRIIQHPENNNYIRGTDYSKCRIKTAQGGKTSNKDQIRETLSAATYLDRQTFDALATYSKETRKSISWIMRDCITEFLYQEGYLTKGI